MNIHPLIVHFPIALLSVYAVLELLRIKILTRQPYWFYVKAVFLFLGSASSLVAFQTGELAAELLEGEESNKLIELHSTWAAITVLAFGVLAVGYFVAWVKPCGVPFLRNVLLGRIIWSFAVRIQTILTETFLVIVVALIGFISLLITGALGGIIVYGSDSDIITHFVYQLFF